MAENKDFNNLLEKVYEKLDSINYPDISELTEIRDTINAINVEENFDILNTRFDELQNALVKIFEQIPVTANENGENSVEELQSFLAEFSYQLAGIRKEFEKQNDDTKTYAMEKIDEITQYMTAAQERLNNSIQNDIKNLENLVSSITNDIATSLTGIAGKFEKYEETVNQDLIESVDEIKATTDEIYHSVEELKNTQQKQNISDVIIEQLEGQKDDIINKIELSLNMLDLFDFEDINRLKESLTEQNTTINEKLADLIKVVADKDDFKNLQNTIDELNLAKILKRVDTIKENVSVLKNWNSRFDTVQENISVLKEWDNQFGAIKEDISVLKDWDDQFDIVNQKIDATFAVASEEPIDYEDFTNKVDLIYENISILNNWTEKLDYINETIDKLNKKIVDLDKEQSEKIEAIEEINNQQLEKIGTIEEVNRQQLEKIETIEEINSQQLEKLNSLEKLDSIESLNIEHSDKIDNIAKSLDVLDIKVTELNEESEREVEQSEKIDLIYETLSLLNNWIMKIDTVDDNVANIATWGYKIEDIKEKLENLSNEFAIITTATKNDTEEYIYTLLDIESDFAKLYRALDESQKAINQDISKLNSSFEGNYKLSPQDIESIKKQFESLNDDISSISKRTNKLIISSDDSNKIFRTNLDELNLTIHELNKKVLSFNPTKQFTLIDNKVNTIKKLMAGNVSSSQNLNEAFMYLAEWIDVTGKVINEIKESVDTVKENFEDDSTNQITAQLSELSSKLEVMSETKAAFVKNIFDDLQGRFISQEEKIQSLENKLEEIESRLSAKIDDISEIRQEESQEDSSSEIKTILDFIASQVISANENSINNKALNQKVEIIEHQLSKFDKNLSKIVSYLDED